MCCPKRRYLWSLLAALLGLGTVFVVQAQDEPPPAKPDVASAIVRADGSLQSADSVAVRNFTNQELAIIYLIEEGSVVEKGDLVAKLDDALVEEKLQVQTIALQTAEAELRHAQEAAEGTQTHFAQRIDLAKGQLNVARLARERFAGKGGEYETKLNELTTRRRVAAQKLNLTEQISQFRKASGAADPRAIDEAAIAVEAAKGEIEILQGQLRLLQTHVRAHTAAELELAIRTAEVDLVQLERELQQQRDTDAAHLEALRRTLELEKERFENLDQSLQACSILAPRSGRIYYANQSRWGDVIEEGAMVQDRQAIAYIPNMEKLEVTASVSERDISRIRVGQSAMVQLAALVGDVFSGRVVHVNDLPEWSPPGENDKKYVVRIGVDDVSKFARVGMTAFVEIDSGYSD